MREQVYYTHGYEASIEAIALMKRSKGLFCPIWGPSSTMERRITKKTPEASLGYIWRPLVMNNPLIVFEDSVLLFREIIWFEAHLKTVRRFWWPLDVAIFALMNCFG